jgi:hypothetical protein
METSGGQVHVSGGIDTHGARVDERRHPVETSVDGFEEVDRPDDVDERAHRRVSTAERHLQGRKVDDIGDPMFIEGRLDRPNVGDVAGHECDLPEILGGHDLVEASVVSSKVEGHDRDALPNE